MGKMTAALILVFAIELALTLFLNQSASTNPTALYSLLNNPVGLSTNNLFALFAGRMAAIAALSAIVVGFFFIIRIETAYALIAATFILFAWNIVHLWLAISSQGIFGGAGPLVATLITGPLLIFYIMATMDWIRAPG